RRVQLVGDCPGTVAAVTPGTVALEHTGAPTPRAAPGAVAVEFRTLEHGPERRPLEGGSPRSEEPREGRGVDLGECPRWVGVAGSLDTAWSLVHVGMRRRSRVVCRLAHGILLARGCTGAPGESWGFRVFFSVFTSSDPFVSASVSAPLPVFESVAL